MGLAAEPHNPPPRIWSRASLVISSLKCCIAGSFGGVSSQLIPTSSDTGSHFGARQLLVLVSD